MTFVWQCNNKLDNFTCIYYIHVSDSGPTNPRVVSTTPTTVRLQWDLPEKASCYGRALIVLILFDRGSNLSTVLTLSSKTTYFDMVQLKSGSNYGVQLGLQLNSGVGGQTDFSFATRMYTILQVLVHVRCVEEWVMLKIEKVRTFRHRTIMELDIWFCFNYICWCVCVCVCVRDWCFTSLSTIFQFISQRWLLIASDAIARGLLMLLTLIHRVSYTRQESNTQSHRPDIGLSQETTTVTF